MKALLHTNLLELARLRRVNAVRVQAQLYTDQLSVRHRNAVLRSLEQAYVPSNAYWGVGMLSKQLLDHAGVFYITGKRRGYIWIDWGSRVEFMPAGVGEALKDLVTADRTASAVAGHGGKVDPKFNPRTDAFIHLHVLKPADHIPKMLKAYTSTPQYQAAVKPLIDFVKSGQPIEINVV